MNWQIDIPRMVLQEPSASLRSIGLRVNRKTGIMQKARRTEEVSSYPWSSRWEDVKTVEEYKALLEEQTFSYQKDIEYLNQKKELETSIAKAHLIEQEKAKKELIKGFMGIL